MKKEILQEIERESFKTAKEIEELRQEAIKEAKADEDDDEENDYFDYMDFQQEVYIKNRLEKFCEDKCKECGEENVSLVWEFGEKSLELNEAILLGETLEFDYQIENNEHYQGVLEEQLDELKDQILG